MQMMTRLCKTIRRSECVVNDDLVSHYPVAAYEVVIEEEPTERAPASFHPGAFEGTA